jgi:PhnB protein
MKLNTYVNFAGRCAEAFRYYEANLGAKVGMMVTHAQTPGPSRVPPEWKDAVLHARVRIGDNDLLGADIPNAQPMRSAYLTLTLDPAKEAERLYQLLSDGGQIFMKMEETFFASRFAMLRDKFGTSWMLLHERQGRAA